MVAQRGGEAWRSEKWLILWLVGVLALMGCGGVAERVATLRASPTPTLTPTSTPTATPTATPTSTPSPTPTATPTLPPPALTLRVEPESPAQGQTVRVHVALDRAAALTGDFDGQPLTFYYPSPTDAWALAGIPPWGTTGERPLVIEAIAPEGQGARLSRTVAVQPRAFELQEIDVGDEQERLLLAGLRPAEDAYLGAWVRDVSGPPLWEGAFGIPSLGIRTSPYGAQRAYQGGPVVSYHGGLDLAAAEGTAVVAAASGVVRLAEPLAVRGNVVVLDHGVGVHTLYFHLSQINVVPGQAVARGDLLGLMGTTGLSTGSHLHWEVRVGEVFVDPDEWLGRDFRQ